MVCSGSPAPHFVNNDYVTDEIISSTSHAHHEVLTWLWARICPVPQNPEILHWLQIVFEASFKCSNYKYDFNVN